MSSPQAEGPDGSTITASVEHPRSSPALDRRNKQLGVVPIFPSGMGGAVATLRSGEVKVGRGVDAGLRLAHASVSREHASISLTGGEAVVRDLGSRHGTFVNGVAVTNGGARAAAGTVIRVGGCLLLVVADAAAYAEPAQRLGAAFLGTARDVWAGPTSWSVWQQATRAASLPQPVLILGESGSGKEAIARLVHASRSEPGPFVALNVAALPEGLFESELFGHARGAFTGAAAPRLGAFREADGGVLFLDEIGDLRLDLQSKLLRAIDQMRVRPLGASADVAVRVRVVAATSRDLENACATGTFRTDLYYRLSGIVLRVAPLRDRRDEVLLIAAATLRAFQPPLELSVEAAEALALAPWPGNVRQLDNVMTQAGVSALGRGSAAIALADLPPLGQSAAIVKAGPVTAVSLVDAIRRADGNASLAAQQLGISRAQLYKLLKRFEIDPASVRGPE